MKNKIKIIIALLFVISISFSASSQNHATTIKIQAMDMGSAFMKNDFTTFAKYMHPNIISFAGGEKKMKAVMDSAYATMKLFGVSFKRYWIGNPGEIISYKDQLQTVLPQSTTMKTPLGELTAETNWIVISSDNGKNWYFIDTNVYQADKIKSVLPDLSPKLVIPPRKQPKLVPNESKQ
jgi:hypothetical protein